MARFWHKPGVLMTAYLGLFVVTGAWAGSRSAASAFLQQVAEMGSLPVAAFLAWRVTRGGWISRGLIIVFTVGLIQKLLWGADLRSGGLVSLGLLALCLAQIGLAVSTPVYERTRKNRADRPVSAARLWPVPPWWMGAAAVIAGLLITLMFLGSEDLRSLPCVSGPRQTSAAQCVALEQGYPVHFLSAVQDGNFSSPVIFKGAAAEDMAIWTALSIGGCYLIWLPSRRPAETATVRMAAPV